VKSDATLVAIYNLSSALSNMSRYAEAEIFAREMVAASDKVAPVSKIHVLAVERLSRMMHTQGKYEEALWLAHDGV
jgi:hypothetical protein